MKFRSSTSVKALFFLIVSSFALSIVGCGNSEDGPILSDSEKLQKASQGRSAYSSGTRDGGSKTQPPAGEGK